MSDTLEIASLVDVTFKMHQPMRKLFFCICENKDADQLRSNGEHKAPLFSLPG